MLGLAVSVSAITVSLPDTTAAPGDTILIPLMTTYVNSSSQIMSYNMDITYNPSVAQCNSLIFTGTITPTSWTYTYNISTPGLIQGGAFTMFWYYLSGEGVLVFLKFVIPANSSGTTELNINDFYYSALGSQIFPTLVNGSITVQSANPPVITYSPASFSITVPAGGTEEDILTLGNSGGGTLEYEIPDPTANWLSVDPSSGIIPSGGSEEVTLFIDASGLQVGTYSTNLIVESNDPANPSVTIPVELQALNAEPTVTILTPPDSGAVAIASYNITWEDEDLNDDAFIDFFYCQTPDPNFTTIIDYLFSINEDDPADAWEWNLSGIPDGEYYVLAMMYDIWGGFCYDYSGMLTVTSVSVTLTPVNPPIQIPANGGSFDFNIAVGNPGTIAVTADIWTMITLPNGNEYGPVIGPVNLTLNPGFSGNRDRTQNVPANAPTGDYTYDAYIGIYPDTIYTEDHFDFEKLAAADGSDYIHDWYCWGESFEGEVIESITPDKCIKLTAFPNPFNAKTVISYQLTADSYVELMVYDVQGREVQSLVTGHLSLGQHEVVWDAEGMSSGIYFVRLQAGDLVQARKMLLIK